MSYNGSGTFVINSTGQPVITGTVISSSTFNSLTADLGTGLSTAITKDGQTTTTAKIPFAFGISAAVASNFAAGTVAAPSIYLSTDTGTGFYRIGANNNGYSVSGTKLLDFSSALFAVTGAATVSTTLGVTGATTLSSTLGVTGVATFSANVTVDTTATRLKKAVASATTYSATVGSRDEVQLLNSTTGTNTFTALQMGNTANMVLNLLSVQNAGGYGDFVIQQYGGAFLETFRITSAGVVTIPGTLGVTGVTTVGVASILSTVDIFQASSASGTKFTGAFNNTHATTPNGITVNYSAADPNGTGSEFLYCVGNATLRASIRSNGGIANFSANNVNLSDKREKTNFAPAKSYLDVICAIPVQTFNYIDQNMEDDPGLTLGVIAQDVEAVAPEMVMESNWGTMDDPKMRLSIYQTDLQYALMKAIQELSAKVATLEAR